MTTAKIKAGIVGFGRMAEGCHLAAMRESGLYDVVGVCDVTESRRTHAAGLDLKATDNLDEFLDWDIEVAVIATHSSAHLEPAVRAAKAGKHLLIEKPLAVNAADSKAIRDAAFENGVAMTVYHNRHFDDDYRMVKAAVREGLIGAPILIENRTTGAAPAVGFGTPDYNQQWRISAAHGGGTLLDFGPHWTEQVLDLMEGRSVVQVWGDVRHFKWGDADDHFRIELLFDDGTRAVVGKSDIAYASMPFKWFILGRDATLRGPMDERVVINGSDYELRRSTAVPKENFHVNLAEHLRKDTPLIVTPDHALRVMEVISAAVESSQAGKSIDVSI